MIHGLSGLIMNVARMANFVQNISYLNFDIELCSREENHLCMRFF